VRKMASEDSDVQGAPSTGGSDAIAEAVAAAAAAIGATDSDGNRYDDDQPDVQGAPSTGGSDAIAEAVAAAAAAIDSDGNSDDDDQPDSSSGGSNSSEESGSLTFQDRIDDCLAVRIHRTAQHTRTPARDF
jgi:hypothetical protein